MATCWSQTEETERRRKCDGHRRLVGFRARPICRPGTRLAMRRRCGSLLKRLLRHLSPQNRTLTLPREAKPWAGLGVPTGSKVYHNFIPSFCSELIRPLPPAPIGASTLNRPRCFVSSRAAECGSPVLTGPGRRVAPDWPRRLPSQLALVPPGVHGASWLAGAPDLPGSWSLATRKLTCSSRKSTRPQRGTGHAGWGGPGTSSCRPTFFPWTAWMLCFVWPLAHSLVRSVPTTVHLSALGALL